ncbi:MAG: DUF6377 domain-containing protein [Leeuwenhoekiella sp.]
MRDFLKLLLIFISINFSAHAQKNDSILSILDHELLLQNSYLNKKYNRIHTIQQTLERKRLSTDREALYNSYINLFEEYKSFKYDSAYYYVEQAKNTALKINDTSLLANAKVKEGFVLISAGLFKEAIDTLNSVEYRSLSKKDAYDYYFTRARSYFDIANYNQDQRFLLDYTKKGNNLLRDAMVQASPSSSKYWAAKGLLLLKQQDWQGAEKAYIYWLTNFDLPPDQYGVATSSLSYVYTQLGNRKKSIEYLAKAAISDIRNAIKENIALRNLANELYQVGELERANTYVHLAMNDATFYNARHRKVEISSILPIIESAQLYNVEQKNDTLEKTVFLLAILAIIVLAFIGIIFKQLKEKNAARKAVNEYNLRLEEVNLSLLEADAIKQDYITYFLKATSDLINKIGTIQKSTIHKIKTKNPEEVLNVLKGYSVKSERSELFYQFDMVFIKLFPSYTKSYNKLFPKEERRILKKGELLNTELRIFALYRLGIQDSQQVADFLDISVATVYTYKTRVKSKSLCKDSFEEKIMKIKRL